MKIKRGVLEMKIKLLKDYSGHREYKAGEILDYEPWPHEWRSMSEPERVAKGIYVYCYGHGDFHAFEAEPVVDE